MKNSLITILLVFIILNISAQNALTNNDINFKEVSYNSSFMTEEDHVVNLSLTSSLSDNVQQTGRIHFVGYGIWHKFGLGVGAKLNSRFRDFYKTTSAEVLLGKQIVLNKDNSLNFGLNFGILYNGINKSILNEHVDLSDNFFLKQENKISFQGGFAMSYVYKNALKIGLSMPELAKSGSDFYPTLFANASYKLNFADDKFYIEPGVLAYFTDVAPFSLEGFAKFGFTDYAWLKVGGRSTKSVVIAAGASYDFINVGYAYNMNFGTYDNLNQMQHNINVGFKFLKADDVERKSRDRKPKKVSEKEKKKKREREEKEKKLREEKEKKEKQLQDEKERNAKLEIENKEKELAAIKEKNEKLQKELKEKELQAKMEKESSKEKISKEKDRSFKESLFKETDETVFITAKLSGYTLAKYYIAFESFKDRTKAKSKQAEMEKMGQKPFIMKDVKTEIFYLCIGSDNSKSVILEKYEILKETVAPKAWIIINQ